MRRYALGNLRRWTPSARRIRKFLEQTSTQPLQEALFVLGILHCAQKFLLSADSNPLRAELAALNRFLRLFGP
jgi:hypothetical protein